MGFEELKAEALRLNIEARAYLARALLASLDALSEDWGQIFILDLFYFALFPSIPKLSCPPQTITETSSSQR